MKPIILCAALVLAVAGCADDPVAAMAFDAAPVAAAGATVVHQPSPKVEELVAPIALYPDVLVAQVLAAATQPADLVHAKLWLDAYHGASAGELAQAVDGQSWDPQVKALTLLPPVLAALNRNFAWTTALGEAYASEPAEVLRAVQAVRREAQAAGKLASTSEQHVSAVDDSILIEPADPQHVYVPGGAMLDIGPFERFAWGWHSWQVDWQHGAVMYQDAPYLAKAD